MGTKRTGSKKNVASWIYIKRNNVIIERIYICVCVCVYTYIYIYIYMSHTGNAAHVAAATNSDSQCRSLHDAFGHQPKGAEVLWKQY